MREEERGVEKGFELVDDEFLYIFFHLMLNLKIRILYGFLMIGEMFTLLDL